MAPGWQALLLTFLLTALVAAAPNVNYSGIEQLAQADPVGAFQQYARVHDKPYLGDEEEYQWRYAIFQANLAKITAHNAKEGVSYWLGLNEHADLTTDEFRKRYLGQMHDGADQTSAGPDADNRHKIHGQPFPYGDETPAEAVDWRAKGLITPVKDQHVGGAPCGCCYAFGGIAGIEAANALYTGKPVSLSEQEMVDCDYLDYGCDGGEFLNIFKFVLLNGGVDDNTDYPYVAKEAKCQKRKLRKHKAVTIQGFVEVPRHNETALMQAVSHIPTSTGVCCGQFLDQWHLYKGGILDEAVQCTDIDHAMLIVGYGTDETTGVPYWIIKNSWGAQWGEGGYGRFKRNVADPKGQSGLATYPAYAYKNEPNPVPSIKSRRGDLRDSVSALSEQLVGWLANLSRA